jgi:predicted ATP-grasp superfamily ATP-dependent carboligase
MFSEDMDMRFLK